MTWADDLIADVIARRRLRSARSQAQLDYLLTLGPDDEVVWPYARAKGYARLRGRYAYQIHWEHIHGAPWPAGAHASHLCHNGAQGCPNGHHVRPGTQRENNAAGRRTHPSERTDGHTRQRRDGRWEHIAYFDGERRSFYGRTREEAELKALTNMLTNTQSVGQ